MKSALDLLESEIKDLYSAEKQLTKALPQMITAAHDEGLKTSLFAHLDETKQQIERLGSVADLLGIKASGKLCAGMEGVIREGAEALAEKAPPAVYDLGIIGAARRVEHYEMAGYMTAIALAEGLRLKEVTALLKQTLLEEKAAEDALKAMMPKLVADCLAMEPPVAKTPSAKAMAAKA